MNALETFLRFEPRIGDQVIVRRENVVVFKDTYVPDEPEPTPEEVQAVNTLLSVPFKEIVIKPNGKNVILEVALED